MTTPTRPMTVADIRSAFLDFFRAKGHTVVASSPLVPSNDPTLMFTNSGMVQFKDVFLGLDKRPYVRAASVQGCLRAGGKHNDLENVGYTARHHTFFEMLGNWSFGDYFKRDSLKWGWELLTQVYRLPADRLWATVYIDDDEAYHIWTQEIGLPPERVVRIGDNKGAKYASDNFWMMADTGPCGPCSEIFYDHGASIAGGPPGSPEQDGDRYIEIWNHVFMQFDMQPDGSLVKLPAPCVDTGLGLERLAAVLQHVHSNYEIDLFAALVQTAARETGCADLGHKSLRVIADHVRAATFLISDGVLPSNEGRGYVQRRIIRRAIRHGYKLGQKTPFFHKLVPAVVALMGQAYPHIKAQQSQVVAVLKAEEERFFETLAVGMEILDRAIAELLAAHAATGSGLDSQRPLQLSGEVAFKLHDTYGFPLDLTQDVCREASGLAVDVRAFDAAMEKQKRQARQAGKFKQDRLLEYSGAPNVFVGYQQLDVNTEVLALYQNGAPVQTLQAGQAGVVVLHTTPFYAESGGQVGDQGQIVIQPSPGPQAISDSIFEVTDTQKIKADVWGQHGVLQSGSLKVGDRVQAQVNAEERKATTRNHSATHLLHQALRKVLGEHVQQKGSLVNAQRARFDFSHHAPVTEAQIQKIEAWVNQEILRNTATQAQLMNIEAAQTSGALMLFGEKYGDTVRVLEIGASRELCGGTHVERTGDIGLFKLVFETGVAAGVRRVEAVTGGNALAYLQQLESTVTQVSSALKTTTPELRARVDHVLEQSRQMEKELLALKNRLAATQVNDLAKQALALRSAEGQTLQFLSARLDGADAQVLRNVMQGLKDKLQSAVIVLAATEGDKVQLAAGVTADQTQRVRAGELVNFVAAQVGGKGGGKPDLAMAAGSQAAHLGAALQSVQAWVEARVC